MAANSDILVLANKVFEMSHLSPSQLDERKWEGFLLVHAIYSSATADGIAKSNADKEARWGSAIQSEGFISALYPKWFLRTDDGKPPVIKAALESAIENPNRNLSARLQTLQLVPEKDREPLTDLVRALVRDAFDGATTDAKTKFSQAMGEISKSWTSDPWLCILPGPKNSPPVLILIDNQGQPANTGDMYDDNADDDSLWTVAVREWDERKFRDNAAAKFFTNTTWAIAMAPEVVGEVVSGAGKAIGKAGDTVDALNSAIKHLPLIVGGFALTALTVGLGILAFEGRKNAQKPEPA